MEEPSLVPRGCWRRLLVALGLLGGATLVYLSGGATPGRDIVVTADRGMRPTAGPEFGRRRAGSDKSEGFVVDTPGCQIPDLPAEAPDIKRFFKKQQPDPKCSEQLSPLSGKRKQRGPPLVQSNLTAMWVVREALHHYNVSDLSRLACCYRPFWRVQDDPVKYKKDADNRASFSKQCVPFVGEVALVNSSVAYVRVECSEKAAKKKAVEIYRDFHAFMPTIGRVEERCNKSSAGPDELSVLVIGMDSVSRLNMLRQLPKTYQLLTSPPFSAVSLLGYNKVGDNTFPNLVPVLMGISEDDLLKAKYWKGKKFKFDDCPFIWKDFAARGYKTAYGEDASPMSTFNYQRIGFVEQPTDYYARPFLYESLKQLGHKKSMNVKLCTGPRQSFEYIIDFIKKFAMKFASERSFGFFWSSTVSHDGVNMPHIGDALLARALAELQTCGALERSVLVLMSDHGMRWGSFRETYQGRMEERLPFVLMSFPEWFRRRFPEAVANLQLNARNRLTTPFDVHETLRDLLQPAARLASDVLRARVRDVTSRATSAAGNTTGEGGGGGGPAPRGVSLFVPISPLRTCEDAAISPHWCTCQTSTPVSTSLPVIKSVVDFVVAQLNKIINSDCEVLHLAEIKYAEEKVPHEEGIPKKFHAQLMDYLVAFKTEPGAAVFEATVRKTSEPKKGATAKFSLTGSISRLSAYGVQSHCVADSTLKLYCYCKHQLEQTTSTTTVN